MPFSTIANDRGVFVPNDPPVPTFLIVALAFSVTSEDFHTETLHRSPTTAITNIVMHHGNLMHDLLYVNRVYFVEIST